MNDLTRRVRETIREYDLLPSGGTVVVGVSGGVDSLCLLHVLWRLAPERDVRLHVGHLEHGIRGTESREDARFVRATCVDWGVPVSIKRVNVPALAERRGLAIEEAARQARYLYLGELARSLDAEVVAVAHHADDQVETVLMHILRGSGLAGLRGMRPATRLDDLRLGELEDAPRVPCAGIRLVRPLLYVERADIERYAREHDLRPRFDRSNLYTTFYRNRLRHELIPYLETYNPNIREVLRRTAEVAAGDYEVLRDVLIRTWPSVVRGETDVAIRFDLTALRGLQDGLLRSILREGIHRLRRSLRNINWVHVEDALRIVRHGDTGTAATLPAGLVLSLGYDDAVLAPEGYRPPAPDMPYLKGDPVPVRIPGRTALSGGWSLHTRIIPKGELPEGWDAAPHPYVAYLDADRLPDPLLVRTRRPGDRLRPLGMGGSQKVSDLMINRKVPRAERDVHPILAGNGEIVWVIGLHVDGSYALSDETRRVLEAAVRCDLAPRRE